MISELQAIILGAIQGVTEFLPVSSSAHLVIVPWLFGWNDPGLAFDVALHMGSFLALLAYYWREWLKMIFSLFAGPAESRRLLALLIVASIPGAAIGTLLEKQAETLFRSNLVLIACALALLGVVLWAADAVAPEKQQMRNLSMPQAVLIGLSQALAIIPGVSRSGATITMARIIGLEREDAANFSFLMATPIIFGAGLFEARKIIHGSVSGHLLASGFISSTIFSFLAIAALVRFVRTRTYQPFAVYRIIAALVVIAVALTRG